MKIHIKRKILEKISSITIRKAVFTSIIVLFIIYRFVFVGGIGIFDKKEKIEESNKVTTEEFDNRNSAENMLKGNKKNNDSVSKITVYITGAVASPGVISIDSDKRLDDAIRLVGGVTQKADINRINLAMKIEDSQHYIIPEKGDKNQESEASQTAIISNNQGESKSSSGKININTADEKLLESIPGVGPSTSKKIVDYRNKEGKFSNIEDIKNVSGIGDKKFDNMKEYIDVK